MKVNLDLPCDLETPPSYLYKRNGELPLQEKICIEQLITALFTIVPN